MIEHSRLLVTGGAGFIGANFIRKVMRETSARVINVDALTYAGNPDNLRCFEREPRYVFIRGDVCDRELIETLLKNHEPHAVVHFAAESHVDRSISDAQAFVRTNVNGTFSLLESVRHWLATRGEAEIAGFRFLHVSTDEVYGSLPHDAPPANEDRRYEPNSPYAASKAASDHFVRAYHHTYGLPTLTTNCSNNYGPFQFPEKLIPLMIRNAMAGESLPLYGDGQNIRDWLYVEDHCAALLAILASGKPGGTYNIGGASECSNLVVVQAVCDLLDELQPRQRGSHRDLIRFVRDRPGHDRRYALDASKVRAEVGWQPQETLASGLRKTVLWYLANTEWVERVTSGDYLRWIEENYADR